MDRLIIMQIFLWRRAKRASLRRGEHTDEPLESGPPGPRTSPSLLADDTRMCVVVRFVRKFQGMAILPRILKAPHSFAHFPPMHQSALCVRMSRLPLAGTMELLEGSPSRLVESS